MTTTPNASPIRNYPFTSNDELFLDTNIWLLIYGPHKPYNTKRKSTYSSAFQHMLAAHSHMYIDVLVLSEFINVWARYYQRQWPDYHHEKSFKKFRRSPEFRVAAARIAAEATRVLRHCSRVDSDFVKLDISRIIGEYGQGDSDFNDQVIRELCINRRLKLVTDDGDFQGDGLSILTANGRLLN